jgi:hypothetical protein
MTAADLNQLPAFCLYMHINAGSRHGIDNIRPYIDDFRDKVEYTGGGLVVLENADYAGYRSGSKNRSRSRTVAAEYADAANQLVTELVSDEHLAVLGTAHDDAWREGKWNWKDVAIDGPAASILAKFSAQMEFEGRMPLNALAHVLRERNAARAEDEPKISLGKAARVIRLLHQSGRANFFYANHLPVDQFLADPNGAIREIERGRDIRRGLIKPL